MMLFSVSAMGVVGVLWVLFGYSMNYFAEGESGFAGNPLKDFGLVETPPADFIGVGFGAVFAMITTALISGAIADRVGLGSWVLFSGVWATLVYLSLIHHQMCIRDRPRARSAPRAPPPRRSPRYGT